MSMVVTTTSSITDSPLSAGDKDGLSVLSYNVWGVFAGQDVMERMALIADRIADYDVICMQEQFNESDAAMLQRAGGHPHIHRSVTAVVGSGLTILSRFPILSTTFIPFKTGGKVERFWEADAYCNRGVAVYRVSVPRGKLGPCADRDQDAPVEVVFFNTHFIAQYQRNSVIGDFRNERNGGHRLSQAHQLAQAVVSVVTPGVTPFVICGDFNSDVEAPEMKTIHAYLALYGLNVHEVVKEATYTADNIYNSGVARTYFDILGMTQDMPVQLDHLLVGTTCLSVTPGSGRVVMKEQIKSTQHGRTIQLSDHFGIACRVLLNQRAGKPHFHRTDPRILTPENRAALMFASSYFRQLAAGKRLTVRRLNWLSLALFTAACIVLPYFLHGHYCSFLLSFLLGMVSFGIVALGHLDRQNAAITMSSAAAELQHLLTKGDCCTGDIDGRPALSPT
jgi:endonuclease/exonuclease/phosphatase family metal-dependent hydrolase